MNPVGVPTHVSPPASPAMALVSQVVACSARPTAQLRDGRALPKRLRQRRKRLLLELAARCIPIVHQSHDPARPAIAMNASRRKRLGLQSLALSETSACLLQDCYNQN